MIDTIWSTNDEIRCFKEANPIAITKLQFLMNYKEALRHRNNWDTLDKSKILKALNREIKSLQGEQKWLD